MGWGVRCWRQWKRGLHFRLSMGGQNHEQEQALISSYLAGSNISAGAGPTGGGASEGSAATEGEGAGTTQPSAAAAEAKAAKEQGPSSSPTYGEYAEWYEIGTIATSGSPATIPGTTTPAPAGEDPNPAPASEGPQAPDFRASADGDPSRPIIDRRPQNKEEPRSRIPTDWSASVPPLPPPSAYPSFDTTHSKTNCL